jgi:ferredoxin
MLANYGYMDASGDFFITIDTDKCNGCGDCVTACPADVFAVLDEETPMIRCGMIRLPWWWMIKK